MTSEKYEARSEKFEYRPLAVTELFEGMSTAEFEAWCGRWTMTEFAAGRVLFKPHQPGQLLLLVYSGRVALYRLWQGEKKVLRTLGPGAIFGQMPLVGQVLPNCFAATTAASRLVILSRAAMEQLIRQRPAVGLKILAQAGPSLLSREQQTLSEMEI